MNVKILVLTVLLLGSARLGIPATQATWNKVNTSSAPPPLAVSGICYDTQNSRILVFGGEHCIWDSGANRNNYLYSRELWAFKDGAWTRIDYPKADGLNNAVFTGCCWQRMVWNPAQNYALISGAHLTDVCYGYTLKFQNGSFSRPSTTGQPMDFHEGCFFDTTSNKAWFVSNLDTFQSFGGSTWTTITPNNIPFHGYDIAGGAMSFNSISRTAIHFGGRDYSAHDGSFTGPIDKTYKYSLASNSWSEISTTTRPPALAMCSMVYNPDRGTHILYGGDNAGGFSDQVWELDEAANTWTKIDVSNPRSMTAFAMVYNPQDKRIYVFGGINYQGYSNELYYLDNLPSNSQTSRWNKYK